MMISVDADMSITEMLMEISVIETVYSHNCARQLLTRFQVVFEHLQAGINVLSDLYLGSFAKVARNFKSALHCVRILGRL